MAIEVWDGTTWIVKTDPEICTSINPTTGAGTFANINKGEVFVGPNSNDWTTFYNRITSNTPAAFSFVSATFTSITVRVIASGSENKKVYAYRTNDSGNFQSSPTNPTTSAINQTFTFSGLSEGTSYNFSSYVAYYGTDDELVVFSTISTLDASTASYLITTPTTPTNTGTISSKKLSFSSSSNANTSTNGVTAYMEFALYINTVLGSTYVDTVNSSALTGSSSTSKTVEFSGLTPGASYSCKARTVYNTPAVSYSPYSALSSATSTYPLHIAAVPFRLAEYTTDTNLAILTDINAYNNGDAKIQWEYQYSTRGSNIWSATITFFGTEVVTGNSTSYYGQNFTVIESREYRFRARVYYVDLGIYGPYINGGAFTGAIRGKTWTDQNTGWIFASSATASDSADGYSPSMGSDGNQGSWWFSDPYHYQAGTATEFKTINAFARTANVGQNLYYLTTNHAISSSYPSISTSINSLRYAVSSVSRDTTQSIYVVLTLESATRCILQYDDDVRIIGTSNNAYVQDYYVMYTSGATVYLAPRGTTPANCSSSTGGTLIVYTSAGYGVAVFGGTSNYTAAADNYFTRTDGDYGSDVPLSVATGQASYTIPTSTKVSSRTTESFSANFTPSLPSGYRNAKLYQFSIRVGPTATPALSNIVVDGVYYGDLGSRTAYQSSTITPDVLNSPPYNISFDIDSGYYSGDGLYYASVLEVQAQITYQILEDI